MAEISSTTHPEPVANDHIIRKLAILSQLAVFKDIIPGYRIRSLTDKEKAEKVGQMVARTREWEQGLVGVYQTYLQSLETELKGKSSHPRRLSVILTLCSEGRSIGRSFAVHVYSPSRCHSFQFPRQHYALCCCHAEQEKLG